MAKTTGMEANAPQKRLRGALPKIGIRPAIDGRRKGVRESLEVQTMGMAKAAADFLQQEPAPSEWPAGGMRDCGHLHWRRGRGGRLR